MFCQLIYHLFLMTMLGELEEAKNFRNSHFMKEKVDGFEGYIGGFMFLNCPFSQLSVKTIKVEPFKQKNKIGVRHENPCCWTRFGKPYDELFRTC
ncbi:hypothetical protein [Bartonella apis]|uniref:hypothetical protein n=1 Tax=Bartonella apis TaxID=1686310 RepID=UPI0018DEAECD|nr:hypothetical protein [Bartonella apis]MBI0177923.1 hypothetical protein [Bartonella apis]